MATVEVLQAELISKILAIQSIDVLQKLNDSLERSVTVDKLSSAQHAMLLKSEQDILENKLISQAQMASRNLEWLQAQ